MGPDFLHLIAGMTLGIIISSIFFFIPMVCLAPMFYSKIRILDVFGFKLERNYDEKWRFIKYTPKLTVTCLPLWDIKKLEGLPPEQYRDKQNSYIIVSNLIGVVLCIAAGIICYIPNNKILRYLGIYLCIYAVARFGIMIWTVSRAKKDSLLRYTELAKDKIRSGIPIELLDLKSCSELPYPNATKAEKALYFPMYFAFLEATRQYELMEEAVNEIEPYVINSGVSSTMMIDYYDMLYYYSRHNINRDKAQMYYNKLRSYIEKDTDANGQRVLGFYALNIMLNKDLAQQYADKALAALDKFSIGSERDLERTMINELFEAIRNES